MHLGGFRLPYRWAHDAAGAATRPEFPWPGITGIGSGLGLPTGLWIPRRRKQACAARLPLRATSDDSRVPHLDHSRGQPDSAGADPSYPPLARSARIQGPVVLAAVISKAGTIENLRALSGHPMLVPAAIEAVSQWRYRPYILNSEPIEVETQITVNFMLSGN